MTDSSDPLSQFTDPLDRIWAFEIYSIFYDTKQRQAILKLGGTFGGVDYSAVLRLNGLSSLNLFLPTVIKWVYLEATEVRADERSDGKYDVDIWCWEEQEGLRACCESYELELTRL